MCWTVHELTDCELFCQCESSSYSGFDRGEHRSVLESGYCTVLMCSPVVLIRHRLHRIVSVSSSEISCQCSSFINLTKVVIVCLGRRQRWVPTSIYRSCIGRSRVMWCAFCWESVFGSTGSCLRFIVLHVLLDLTKLVVSDTKPNRVCIKFNWHVETDFGIGSISLLNFVHHCLKYCSSFLQNWLLTIGILLRHWLLFQLISCFDGLDK